MRCIHCIHSSVVRGALKLRYLVLGGAITGGVTLNKKYDEWKEGLPDFKWVDDILPDTEQWSKFSKSMKSIQESVVDSIDIGALHFMHSRDCVWCIVTRAIDYSSVFFQIPDSSNWAKIRWPNGANGSTVVWTMLSKRRPPKHIQKLKVSDFHP